MTQTSRVLRGSVWSAVAIAAVLALAACSKKHDATQAAARVDGTEITVHQINFRLQRERGLRADQMDAAGRRVLEQLIDEQLVVEKAEKDKLDKEADGEQAVAAARRDVLSRGYIEQVGLAVPPPTDEAMHRYYDDNDALFAHRRVYTLHEFLGRVPAAQIPALKALVDAGKPVADIAAWLKAQNATYREQEGVHPAEQVPLNFLKPLAALSDGQGLLVSSGDQVHITYIVSSESQPVTFDRAKPAISQFLLVEARRKATEGNVAALKSSAKITYAPEYAALAASQAPIITTQDIAASAVAPVATGAHVTLPDAGAASGVQVTLPAASNSNVQVTLPATTPGVRVSLPTAASSVEVRLPPQTGTDSGKK